jgi:hypothetical protein
MTPSTDMPRREGSRDGQGGCVMCGGDLPSPRARYCTRACQQHSYRLRHQTPTVDLTRCATYSSAVKRWWRTPCTSAVNAVERFLGERRCAACGLFARALGFGGSCPECDTPVLHGDLLGEGVIATV